MGPCLAAFVLLMLLPAIASAQPCSTAADKDCDGMVNMTELTDYIDLWYGCSACAPDLLEAITAYYSSAGAPEGGTSSMDSLLHLGRTGYAALPDSNFTDLDYSMDFSAEVIFNIPPNYGETFYDPIMTKSSRWINRADYPGWGIVLYLGQNDDFGKQIQASIKDGLNGISFYSAPFAGNVYAVLVWDADERNATLYVNGQYQGSQANSDIVPQNIRSASSAFMIGGLDQSEDRLKREVMMARLWNRELSGYEIRAVWSRYQSTTRNPLPDDFDRSGLVSEWLMQDTSDSAGGMGTTHLKDSSGNNHLALTGGAEVMKANGRISAAYPENGSTGIDKNPRIMAEGGAGVLAPPIARPLHYFFQIDETPSFGSPEARTSGRYENYAFVPDWTAYYGEFTPTLKPGTTYYWRVKVRDSGVPAKESGWSGVYSFATEGPSSWYVRPHSPGKAYGAGDGSSYADAWNGLVDIKWGEEGVEAGDTLFICGPQLRQVVTFNYGIDSGYNYMKASGYSDEFPITITTACPGDPGKVYGFCNRSSAIEIRWQGPDGNGIYSTTDLIPSIMTFLVQDIGGPTERLLRKTSSPDLEGQYGAYYYNSTSRVAYVRLSDGGNPSFRVFDQYGPFAIKTNGKSYLRFEDYFSRGQGIFIVGKSLGSHVGSTLQGVTDPTMPVSKNITIDRCDISYCDFGVLMHDGNDYITVKNSRFSDMENGVYLLTFSEPGPQFAVIENNTFGNIGIFSPVGDAHAIGVASSSNLLIQNNRMLNTGSSIELFAWGDIPQSNITIRYNVIRNTTRHSTSGNGITLSGTGSDTAFGTRLNNHVYGNVVMDAQDYCYSTNHRDRNYWYNNVCYNGRYGFNLDNPWSGPNSVMYNNIVVNAAGRFYSANGKTGIIWDIVSDNNLFHKENGTAYFYIFGKDIPGATNLSVVNSYGYDTHSMMTGPLFIDPENEDFHLQPGSPAIDNGTIVPGFHCPTAGPHPGQDCREWSGLAPDIGAFEYG